MKWFTADLDGPDPRLRNIGPIKEAERRRVKETQFHLGFSDKAVDAFIKDFNVTGDTDKEAAGLDPIPQRRATDGALVYFNGLEWKVDMVATEKLIRRHFEFVISTDLEGLCRDYTALYSVEECRKEK